MTDRDFTALDAQIDNAEAHHKDMTAPGRKWTQVMWFASCGTYGCIAGNTVLDDLAEKGRPVRPDENAFQIVNEFYDGREIEDVAAEALGLRRNEADALFYGGNTIEALRTIQAKIKAGEWVDSDFAEALEQARLEEMYRDELEEDNA